LGDGNDTLILSEATNTIKIVNVETLITAFNDNTVIIADAIATVFNEYVDKHSVDGIAKVFAEGMKIEVGDAVPSAEPVATDMLVGAIHCPLWEADRSDLWRGVLRHPERMPALGLYTQEDPQVADWEAKWALEHGISFFVYCWYRDGEGGAVKTRFGRGLHDGVFKSTVAKQMKFALLWENQADGIGGVADDRDFLDNLVPYWIETYFTHPGYLQVDGQPVLFIYEIDRFIQDLGGPEPAARAIAAPTKFSCSCAKKATSCCSPTTARPIRVGSGWSSISPISPASSAIRFRRG
jgi:hypothetical protein